MPTQASSSAVAKHRQITNLVVYVAVGSDVAVALVKFAAAAFTGSAAMFSEGIHSLVDVLTGVLLIYGAQSSHRPSTREHQFGFGREVFFWNFIVSMAILTLGAGTSLVEGIRQFLMPHPIDAPVIDYVVLGAALLAESVSLFAASRGAGLTQGRRTLRQFLKTNRDATSFTVLFSSASGILGLLTAICGTVLAVISQSPQYDGAASIVIAGILGFTALFLAHKSRDLLIGVPASHELIGAVQALAMQNGQVRCVNGSLSIHIAPDQILVALSVQFMSEATTSVIEQAIADIDREVRRAHPDVVIFIIKPQNAQQFAELRTRRGW